MVLKRGSSGPQVRALQQAILALGYQLPRWGADGELGAETLDALALLLADHGRAADLDRDKASVSDEELALVLRLAEQAGRAGRGAGAEVIDLRARAGQGRARGMRSWKNVTGICLHQTACVLGERPTRWANVGCHVGVTRGGKVIWLHDFTKLIVHGHGWNARTVGIEMDGTYAGIEGQLRTFWRPKDDRDRRPQSPTPALIEAARDTVRWIVEQVAAHGGRVRSLVAHRQSSNQRDSDPGSALWQAVALPLQAELGLSDGGKGFRIGSGSPIPEAWNPAYKGVRY